LSIGGNVSDSCRVHLINPPSAPGTVANREGAGGMGTVYCGPKGFLYPPHTLAMVAGSLRDAGYPVRASDLVVEKSLPNLADADAVGVFVSHATLDNDLAFLTNLRKRISAMLVAFGPAMRFVGEDVLARAPVDAVLVGEAEALFVAALRHFGRIDSPARRLWTADELSEARCDEDGLARDLDALPFPAWDLLPHERYSLLTVMGSRGCPDQCVYCPYAAAQGHRFRARSVASVLAELAWLDEGLHPGRVVFRDPVFARDPGRVVDLCEGMLERELHLRWECESRPEHFDTSLLQLMKRAGCQWVKVGLETTDKVLLQRLKRVDSTEEAAAYVQHVADVVQTCNQIDLLCRLFVMAGLPGQNQASAEDTARFVKRIRPAALNVKLFERYPGMDAVPALDEDRAAQVEILHQVQQEIQSLQPGPSVVTRARRWLRGVLRRGRHG